MLKIKADNWTAKKFKELGRGGEAVIYQLKPDTAAKVFLLPTDPQYRDFPGQKEAAKVRLEEMQTKLFDFPRKLPAGLVAPQGVLLKDDKQVFGYVMPFVDGISMDKLTKIDCALTLEQKAGVLLGLYDLVGALHQLRIVIGDFNENNVIVAGNSVYLIDADSMQFGRYQCRSFMPRYTAPELLDVAKPTAKGRGRKKTILAPAEAVLARPHSELGDWYSFLVIAMRLIVNTDPYGGVAEGMDLLTRLKDRITIFDQRVLYPKIAKPLSIVPRPLLRAFYQAFKLGERFIPEKKIFELHLQDPASASMAPVVVKKKPVTKKPTARKKKPATTAKKGRKANAKRK